MYLTLNKKENSSVLSQYWCLLTFEITFDISTSQHFFVSIVLTRLKTGFRFALHKMIFRCQTLTVMHQDGVTMYVTISPFPFKSVIPFKWQLNPASIKIFAFFSVTCKKRYNAWLTWNFRLYIYFLFFSSNDLFNKGKINTV